MVSQRDDEIRNQTRYISLSEAERQVRADLETIGIDRYMSDPKFQKTREKWLAVGYGLLIERMMKKQLWLKMVPPDQEPPDVIMMVNEPKDGRRWGKISLEITEAAPFEYARTNLKPFQFILKCIDKKTQAALAGNFSHDMQLLVYCNIEGRVDIKRVRSSLQKSLPPFSQIWMLGALEEDKTFRVSLWELWPGSQGQAIVLPVSN